MELKGHGLTFAWQDSLIFRKLNISVTSGELLMVTGANGAGKTTLLKILAGLLNPERGTVQIIADNSRPTFARYYLGHQNGLKPLLSIDENIGYLQALYQFAANESLYQQLLQDFGLVAHRGAWCGQLSAGQSRKVALMAMVLANKPIWLLDEPFTALDQSGMQAAKVWFNRHLAEGGMIVMTSHSVLNGMAYRTIELGTC